MNPNVDFYRSGIDQARLTEIQRYETNQNLGFGNGLPLSQTTSLASNQSIRSSPGSIPMPNALIQGTVPMNPPPPMHNQMFQNGPSGSLNLNPMLGMPSGSQRPNLPYSTNPPAVMAPKIPGIPNAMQPMNIGNQFLNAPFPGNTGNIIGANPMGNNLPNNPGLLNSTMSSSSSISSIRNANQLPLNNPHVQGNNFPMPPNSMLLPQGNPQANPIPKLPSAIPQLPPTPAFNPTLPNKNQVPLPPVPGNIPIPGMNLPPQNNIPIPSPPINHPGNNFLAGQPNFPIASGNPLLPPRNNLNLPSNPPIPGFPILNNPGLQGLPIPNIPSFPRIPNPGPSAMNFPPPPQGNPPFFSKNPQNPILSSSSSESSIEIQRVSINAREIENAQNSGDFMRIQNRFPKVDLFADNAGEGQEFINVRGPRSDAQDASRLIGDLRTESDTHWRYLDDSGKFQKYPLNHSNLIEQDFTNGNESSEINTGSHRFSIKFGTNGNPHTQVSTSNEQSIYRTVRRGPYAEINRFEEKDIIWYWSDEVSNKMRKYEPEACKAIELFYQKFLKANRGIKLRDLSGDKLKTFILKASVLVSGTSGFSYMMDFANMVQINEQTRRWRGISRGNPNGTLRVSQIKAEDIPYIPHPDLD